MQLTLRPITSDGVYSRKSYNTDRRGPWTCYHGFKRFMLEMFEHGATRVKTAHGDWRSEDEFRNDLPNLDNINVGSIMYPRMMGDSPCECWETDLDGELDDDDTKPEGKE